MYLIVRTSDLPSLAHRRARVLPRTPLLGPLRPPPPLSPRLSRALVHDHAIGERDLAGCCGCVPAGDIGQQAPRASEPMQAAAPPPFSPHPDDDRFTVELDAIERRHLERRVGALEAHVDVLAGALARRDAVERAEREREEALERAEDRVFGALVELLSSAWERWREERRRLRPRR